MPGSGRNLILDATAEVRLAASYLEIAASDPACEAGFLKLAKRRIGLAADAMNERTGMLGEAVVIHLAQPPRRQAPRECGAAKR